MWTCMWTNDIVLGGQNVVFLRVIMYRFVFYHVSPVPVVNLHHFLEKSLQFYFMLIFFFFFGKQWKMYVYIKVGSALSL